MLLRKSITSSRFRLMTLYEVVVFEAVISEWLSVSVSGFSLVKSSRSELTVISLDNFRLPKTSSQLVEISQNVLFLFLILLYEVCSLCILFFADCVHSIIFILFLL